MTGSELITGALTKIRVARAGDVPSAEDLELGRVTLNTILNLWNADERAVYAKTVVGGLFTPALSPHTIGPTGTWVVAQRPERIEAAELGIPLIPTSARPITVRGFRWYSELATPGLTSIIPTDVYYEKGWPDGSLYFWPVPTAAYTCALWVWTLFSSIAAADVGNDYSLPPGYDALMQLTLAQWLAPSFGQPFSADLQQQLTKVEALVWGINDEVPRIATADAGLSQGRAVGFNYLSRTDT